MELMTPTAIFLFFDIIKIARPLGKLFHCFINNLFRFKFNITLFVNVTAALRHVQALKTLFNEVRLADAGVATYQRDMNVSYIFIQAKFLNLKLIKIIQPTLNYVENDPH